jgi:hypothetical protein
VQESDNIVTCNETLKKWLPRKEKISQLLAQVEKDKIEGKTRVAYQIPEEENGKCGRSFEEAFILKNSQVIFDNRDAIKSLNGKLADYADAKAIQDKSFDVAGDISKKTDFAFDMMMIGEWATPKYIKDGLLWLKEK